MPRIKHSTCEDLKRGIYYCYDKTGAEAIIRREEGFQYENEKKTGDSTMYKIEWVDDCTYTLKYVSGSAKQEAGVAKLLKDHKFAFEVTKVTDKYYVYKGYLDNVKKGVLMLSDTIWFEPNVHFGNPFLFEPVSEDAVSKLKISDTSRYALLYVYRIGKFTNSLFNYLVYANDYILCVAKNNSGYIFKVFKEGSLKLTSKTYNDKASVDLNIRFGKTYYTKSLIIWGIHANLNNYKLQMAEVDAHTGKEEFEKVKHK